MRNVIRLVLVVLFANGVVSDLHIIYRGSSVGKAFTPFQRALAAVLGTLLMVAVLVWL